jgi:hypothetical protein
MCTPHELRAHRFRAGRCGVGGAALFDANGAMVPQLPVFAAGVTRGDLDGPSESHRGSLGDH